MARIASLGVAAGHVVVTGAHQWQKQIRRKALRNSKILSNYLVAGPGGATHQTAEGDRGVAHDQPGRHRRGQSEHPEIRGAGPVASGRFRVPGKDHPFRSRANSRAHRPRARIGRARLFRGDQSHSASDARRRSSPRRARKRKCSRGSRPSLAARGRATCPAMCAALRSNSIPMRAISISSATTSPSSSSRMRSSFPISSIR